MKRLAMLSLCILLSAATAAQAWAQGGDKPLRIVLTNDDGIEAEGLLELARAFAPVAETYVIAPMANRSGSTNYVSAIAKRQIEVEPRDLGEGITAYGVDGYPADAVVFALNGLLADEPPDLVISGVNTGPNLAGDWNLSGTVGAAQIAAFFGIPAIAVSGWTDDHPETLAATADWVVQLSRSRLVSELEPGQYLTVSVPRVPVTEIGGVEIVRRGPRPWRIELERSADEASEPGRERWGLRFASREVAAPVGSDVYAYEQGRIAIVPMRVDEHDWELLEQLLESGVELPAWPPGGGAR
jgi:5'-nucleotidase